MREAPIESFLQTQVMGVGGAAAKFKPTIRGEPDQLISFPLTKHHCLVEVKWATGVQAQQHQLRRHQYWRDHGMDVVVLTSKAQILAWLHGPMRKHWATDEV